MSSTYKLKCPRCNKIHKITTISPLAWIELCRGEYVCNCGNFIKKFENCIEVKGYLEKQFKEAQKNR